MPGLTVGPMLALKVMVRVFLAWMDWLTVKIGVVVLLELVVMVGGLMAAPLSVALTKLTKVKPGGRESVRTSGVPLRPVPSL